MPYNNSNPSWSQPQATFSQQSPQMKDFDFNAMSDPSADIQSQANYTYQQQLPGNSQSTGIRANYSPGQSQARSVSFGNNVPAVPVDASSFTGFGGNRSQSQDVESFNTVYSQDQMAWNNRNSFGYGKPIPTNNYSTSAFNNAADSSYLGNNGLSSSPNAMQDAFPQSSQYSYGPSTSNMDPRHKRARSQDEARDDEQEVDASEPKDAGKAKSKREHLLSQIREQAAQIKALMEQLESHGGSRQRRPSSATSDSFASSSALQSPLLSPTTTQSSLVSAEPTSDSEANKAIEDWIAKAKQSFQDFDDFIGIGGAGMPKSYLVEGDLEKAGSDDEYVNVPEDGSDFEFAVEHHDGDEVAANGTLKHRGSASSLGTNGTTTTNATEQTRRKPAGGSEKPAILPGEAVPIGLFADLSLKSKPKRHPSGAEVEEEDKTPGIANANFFRSTPAPKAIDKRLASLPRPPQILAGGHINPQEAEELFRIYFDRMNLSVSLLDPVLYTAQRTLLRSPFLFTVVCAIASRFYTQRPSLYPRAMDCAQRAAGEALISGHKNVEMCSAFILLSLYPVPAKRWEDQRGWLYLGLAIRTATDLNLHLPNTAKPINENHAREMLNRTRVWLNCFNLDRSTGSQYGKPPIISSADYMANHSETWWKSSPYNMKNFDIHICAYNAELKVMAQFIQQIYSDPDHPTGLNKHVDFERIATETDDKLKQLAAKWNAILDEGDLADPQNSFRTGLIQLAYSYARLAALSYGFQHAFGKNHTDENPFLTRCLAAAFDVVNPVLNDLCRPSQRIYFRHGPEAQSVFLTFASAFLVKLLQPKFASYLTIQKRLEIRDVVQKVVDLLSSPEIAIDDRQGPGLYARFLKGLLAAPMAQVDPTSPPPLRKTLRVSPSTASYPTEVQQRNAHNTKSRASSASLSPAPRLEALSFESFAPVGAVDPFAPPGSAVSNSLALHVGGDDGTGLPADFFQPPLPFDDAILNSMQSLSDPNVWHDITLPSNFNWNTFQQSLDMDYRIQDPVVYSEQQQYMTGVQH
ncbi:hypothetical protein H0H92_007476 [Tricholoma furcatifolium]|nr:hypothetical protein H0H92_007476 [Tricholoma furcatifolium]